MSDTTSSSNEMPTREILLDLPSDINLMSVLDAVVSQVCRDLKFDGDATEQIGVAVIEAGMNAVKHGNKFDLNKRVRIGFIIDSEKVLIRIQDQGAGFDPDAVADPLTGDNLFRDHGRGILMIRAYMDDAWFDKNGTELTMMKLLPH